MTGYDVIGDVHGHADKLVGLLRELGYRETDGAWRHSERQAVFVGDLVDRGKQQRETVRIARSMVDAGSAQIVLGNHEFNAIAYATWDEERGDFCRARSARRARSTASSTRHSSTRSGSGPPRRPRCSTGSGRSHCGSTSAGCESSTPAGATPTSITCDHSSRPPVA